MKKLSLLFVTFLIVLTLSGCSDLCIGTECITGETPTDGNGETPTDCTDTGSETGNTIENEVLTFTHIDGHGAEEEFAAIILFEEELQKYRKYQVTYLSCTCRDSVVNYWQVAYVEVKKSDNTIQKISFGEDNPMSAHPYTPGMWGDSTPTPTVPDGKGGTIGGRTLEEFNSDFIPWLVGKSLADLDGISVFTNEQYFDVKNTVNIAETDLIDSFAGSSVSTNNMIRMVKALLEYHEAG